MRSDTSRADHGAPLTDAFPTTISGPPDGSVMVDSTDGVRLAVHDLGVQTGVGSPRPILLTHATGFHGRVWEPAARALAGFHAWAPDLRGHGDSPAPERDMDWNGFADDVLAVVDALRARGLVEGPLVAAGHSKGGAALLLAEERRPGTFAALYLYEPVVHPPGLAIPQEPDGRSPNPMADGARRRRATFASRREAYDNYVSKPPFSALDPRALRAYVDHGFADAPDGTVRLKCRPEIEAQVYEMAPHHDAFAHLGEVHCPVTVAMGATDGYGPAAFAEQIAAALPEGRLVRYPDLGHFGPLEAPGRIAAGIAEAVTPPA